MRDFVIEFCGLVVLMFSLLTFMFLLAAILGVTI